MVLKQILILYNIKWFVIITEIECAYCAVRAAGLTILQFSLLLAYTIPSLPMLDLWWTKWHWGRVVSKYFSFPLSLSFHLTHNFIATSILAERQVGAAWGPSIKQCYFENLKALDGIVLHWAVRGLRESTTSHSSHCQRLMQNSCVGGLIFYNNCLRALTVGKLKLKCICVAVNIVQRYYILRRMECNKMAVWRLYK
jgi:hypothetical protein